MVVDGFWIPEPEVEADFAVASGNLSLLVNVMQTFTDEGIAQNIDGWIDTAITEEKHTIVLYLLDYKASHDLYVSPDWSL